MNIISELHWGRVGKIEITLLSFISEKPWGYNVKSVNWTQTTDGPPGGSVVFYTKGTFWENDQTLTSLVSSEQINWSSDVVHPAANTWDLFFRQLQFVRQGFEASHLT